MGTVCTYPAVQHNGRIILFCDRKGSARYFYRSANRLFADCQTEFCILHCYTVQRIVTDNDLLHGCIHTVAIRRSGFFQIICTARQILKHGNSLLVRLCRIGQSRDHYLCCLIRFI